MIPQGLRVHRSFGQSPTQCRNLQHSQQGWAPSSVSASRGEQLTPSRESPLCLWTGKIVMTTFFSSSSFFFFLPAPGRSCGMWDLHCGMRALSCSMHVGSSSLARDRTQAPCIGSTESYPLDHQGSPMTAFFI